MKRGLSDTTSYGICIHRHAVTVEIGLELDPGLPHVRRVGFRYSWHICIIYRIENKGLDMGDVTTEIGALRLRDFMRKWHQGRVREQGGRVYEELWTPDGAARIDMAYLGEKFEGLEFKGDRDGCARLPGQIKAYNRVFEMITIVTGQKLAREVASIVPPWWGLAVARPSYGWDVSMRWERLAKPNPERDAVSLAGFLWRGEAMSELERLTGKPADKRATRAELASQLASLLDVQQVSEIVHGALRARPEPANARAAKWEQALVSRELLVIRANMRDAWRWRSTPI